MPRSCDVEDLEDLRGVIENIIGRGNYYYVYKSESDKSRGESHRFLEVDDLGPALRVFRHEVSDDEDVESPSTLIETTTTEQPGYLACLNEHPENQGVGGILNVVEFERIVPEENDGGKDDGDGKGDDDADNEGNDDCDNEGDEDGDNECDDDGDNEGDDDVGGADDNAADMDKITDDDKTEDGRGDAVEEVARVTPTAVDDFRQLVEVVSEIVTRGNYFHGQRRKHDRDCIKAQRRPPENRITRDLTDIGDLVNVFKHELDGANGSKSELLTPFVNVKGRRRLCLNRKEGDGVEEGFLFVYEYERTGKDQKKAKRRLGMTRKIDGTKHRSGMLSILSCMS